ncbi:NAD(P)-binding protein [Coniochaeta ligniaria NRRL 30616]|uniref:NAD(P)-binding protein n=1 Tax=Coniochaeta ligniaria NRRL 30616 TaxID=1408157 RepID=A0A1J7JED9_9PEZI|nr:NAD(P)-binding protein [Coniochaeta ligniaria NRRL 30616]
MSAQKTFVVTHNHKPPTTPTTQKTILVTGATGRQGSGVITALLSSQTPYTILALTRNPSSPAAQHLATLSPSLHLIQGNLSDIPALFAAATAASSPIWGVYSVQVSMGPGVTEESEVAQGTGLIDAAVAHGVRYFVYSSVDRGGDDASWETQTPIPHFRSKHRIEHHLRAATQPDTKGAGMAWTVLRPVAFMDNLKPGFETSVFLAALRKQLPRNKKVQWVASADIGRFAAMAFDQPEEWQGRAVGLAGDELTMEELSAVFERATGRPARVAYEVFGSLLTTLVRELGLMIGWFASDGYGADVQARRGEYPALMDLEAYLRGNKEWQAGNPRGDKERQAGR